MLPYLNKIAEQHTNPTHNTEATITHLLDYTATNTTAIVQHKASDIIVHIGGDESYLSKTWELRRTEGH